MLNVCHRLLLTRENLHLQNQVVKVVKLVIESAKLWTDDLRKPVSKRKGSSTEDSKAEGQKTAEKENKIDDDFSDDDNFQAFQGDDEENVNAAIAANEDLKDSKDNDIEFDDDEDDFQKFESVGAADGVAAGDGAADVSTTKNAFEQITPPPEFDVGEGGANGDEMEAGKSVVFATLEVCLCALLRQIPALNPQAPQTGI